MAGRLILDSFSPVLDNDGNVISGAKLHFRDAGTTDPKTTYLTMALDAMQVHANPILTDAAGRLDPTSLIWAADGEGYDVLVTDADDVEIRLLEDIYALSTTAADTTTGGTIINNAGDTTGRDALAVAFRASLNVDITVAIDNGYSSNGNTYPTFDTTDFDTHSGLNLAFAYGALTNHSAQDAFYSPSTAYVVPAGMGGLWMFGANYWIKAADEQNVFGAGISHNDSTGTSVYEDPAGQDYQTATPSISLAPSTGVFDNGVSVACAFAMRVNEGDFIRPFLIRGVHDATMTISGYNTNFWGYRIGAIP